MAKIDELQFNIAGREGEYELYKHVGRPNIQMQELDDLVDEILRAQGELVDKLYEIADRENISIDVPYTTDRDKISVENGISVSGMVAFTVGGIDPDDFDARFGDEIEQL